jgi:hypothetical protein
VRGGINFTDLASDTGTFDSRIGVVAGAFATVPLFGFEVQPEALYVVKGAKSPDPIVSIELQLDYLEVPVLARFSRPAPGMRWYAIAGPTFAVRLRAVSRFDFEDGAVEEDYSDLIERFDFGIAVGGGVEFGRFVFDGRYTHGLSNIDPFDADDERLRNRAIAITAGIRF